MWWLPFVSAGAIGVGLWALQLTQQHLRVGQTKTYRAKYIQLISQLDALALGAGQLEPEAVRSKDDKLLDYFESCLRILETLISAISRIPAFGGEVSQLNSGFFLIKDCRLRLQRLGRSFVEESKGKKVDLDFLYGRSKKGQGAAALGCYFCSRPHIASQFSQVRVKIDDETREVLSCNVCRDELKFTKKVKVLFLMRDGKPVHWSEVPNYKPSEDYWNINKRNSIRRETRLELVKSADEVGEGPSPQLH